jgi:hypothetical protein
MLVLHRTLNAGLWLSKSPKMRVSESCILRRPDLEITTIAYLILVETNEFPQSDPYLEAIRLKLIINKCD